MTRPRILICLHDFHRGGTERVALMLAAQWHMLGADVTILCGDQGGGLRDEVAPGIKVMALDPPVPRGPVSRVTMGQAVSSLKMDPDVIFLPGNFHFFLAPYLRKAMPHAKIVLKISNPPVPAGLMGSLAALFFRRATRTVDGFAAMNAGLARQMRSIVPGRVVGTLYDPVRMGDAPRAARGEGPHILWIGRLEPQKDLGLALAVMRQMPGARLTVIGDGADRGLLAGADVRHIPQVPDVAPCLAEADALLITSRYEGGPAVAVEALAQGVPVVSTDCSYLLHELLAIPQAGRIVASRDPAMLAEALVAVTGAARPPLALLRGLTERFEANACARAYLAWFATL
jgi:glycosyltransferase involved in cell wall biosynthesis